VEAPPEILIIGRDEVRHLLSMERCIDVVAEALGALARGDATNPLRTMMALPSEGSALAVMPAALGVPPVIGLKAISVFPKNRGTGFESHQGFVLLFEPEHGAPVALVDAAEVTAIRTAAASGVATWLLAREDADDLAILGSGAQATTHLEAMLVVRPRIRRIRVWSPTKERREAFAAEAARQHGRRVEAMASAREAIEGASIICTVSAAREPILMGGWLADGSHVNAVGSAVPTSRELDAEAVRRARLIVDSRESTLHESGDFLLARSEGAVDDGHIAGELGEVINGAVRGREAADQITLFESHGLAVEDLAAAREVWVAARERSLGSVVTLT
jgi:ornithine cyclodeaminase/alanine dehydrogenase-like protein (mu-crystallin family)